MKGSLAAVGRAGATAVSAALLLAAPALGASYDFDIVYSGNDVASLAPGSDNPDGLQLFPGDDFEWTITPDDGRFWVVDITKEYFPLMAFGAGPSGKRTGDFDLVLRRDGADVFSFGETDAMTMEVHVGTNAVPLDAGLEFDEMHLAFTLTASTDVVTNDPVDTFLETLLPIFGAPENNQFDEGIRYIPEPGAGLLIALTLLAAARRRVG